MTRLKGKFVKSYGTVSPEQQRLRDAKTPHANHVVRNANARFHFRKLWEAKTLLQRQKTIDP